MTAYITKYALSQGILEMEVKETGGPAMVEGKINGYTVYFHGSNWHLDREEAVAQAEKMRLLKIKSLNKSLAKMEKLKFV